MTIASHLQRPEQCRYRGHRSPGPLGYGECTVEVLPSKPGVIAIGYPLPHLVRHSPAGFEWGYGGSGPADLARSLLAHHLNNTPPNPRVYQRFKAQVVQLLPRDPDGEWELTSEQVAEFLATVLDEIGVDCPVCLDSGFAEKGRCPCQTGQFCDCCGGLIGPSGCACDKEE